MALAASVWLLLSGVLTSDAMSAVPADTLRKMVDRLQIDGTLEVRDTWIVANRILIDMYDQSDGQPLWRSPGTARQLITAIEQSRLEGLRPQDYHLPLLTHMGLGSADPPCSPHCRAERDLVLSDALIRLSFHLYYGKVDPRAHHSRWPLPAYIGNKEAATLLIRQIESGRIGAFIDSLRPHHPVYGRLVTALSRYQRIADAGGWSEIPDGPLVEKGDRDVRVPLIRRRLRLTGDLPATATDSGAVFDDDLEDAAARFQDRHRIDTFAPGDDDRYGAVGAETREQMNVSVARRIDQIRINLERARWVLHHLPPTYLIADIADFTVVLVEDDQPVWRARAQVGDAYRKTPVFRSKIKYMEINPTWTVPPGILDATTLPQLRKGPRDKLLEHFVVYGRDGKRVADPSRIPWERYTGSTLPYQLVQQPGPDNPMGQIKFIFPNPDFVFIHDTPRRDFFDREKRDLSAGCIRIERPFELARSLLQRDGQPAEDRLQTLLRSGRTERIHLKDPFPVILFYGTVSVNDQGVVAFREDIYERDPALLQALDEPAAPPWRKKVAPAAPVQP